MCCKMPPWFIYIHAPAEQEIKKKLTLQDRNKALAASELKMLKKMGQGPAQLIAYNHMTTIVSQVKGGITKSAQTPSLEL